MGRILICAKWRNCRYLDERVTQNRSGSNGEEHYSVSGVAVNGKLTINVHIYAKFLKAEPVQMAISVASLNKASMARMMKYCGARRVAAKLDGSS